MENIDFNNPLSKSKDLTEENILKLKELFPEAFTEGKIDFEVLQELLGKEIEVNEERYHFNWAGKAQARREAQKVSTGTLRPCKEESVDFDTTENLYIEGDNLEVLKLLQKSYYKKIKMIYIDPPYNTGKDFVYKDDYKDNLKNYEKITKQRDEEGNKLSTNSETNGRYHSNWLNMMYPRLKLARNLLTDDGVIFISIDDKELHNLKQICDEVFWEDNFIANLVWQKKTSGGQHSTTFLDFHEYILVFSKNKKIFKGFKIKRTAKQIMSFKFTDEYFSERGKYLLSPLKSWLDFRKTLIYDIICPDGSTINNQWICSEATYLELKKDGRIEFKRNEDGEWSIYKKQYLNDNDGFVIPPSLLLEVAYTLHGKIELKKIFNKEDIMPFPKPKNLIKYIISMNLNSEDFILDFFSGSATTAHAVLELNKEDGGNRKFICVQLPEPTPVDSEAYKAGYKTIAEIGKERIRRVINNIKEEKEKQLDLDENKLDLGFKVLKLDSSNIVSWDPETKELQRTLLESVNNIKEDRTNEDVLFEILLKLGLPLTVNISEREIEKTKVYIIGNGELFICLDTINNLKVADGIVEIKNELNPEVCRVVFRNTGFINDVIQTNTIQILKRGDIQTVLSI